MSRTVKNRRLDTGTARERLKVGTKRGGSPHWYPLIHAKLHIGYIRRHGQSEGAWFMRRYLFPRPESGSPYRKERLGVADDVRPADGTEVLSWEQATDRARERLKEIKRLEGDGANVTGPITVRIAIADYVKHLRAKKNNAVAHNVERRAAALILPQLGDLYLNSAGDPDKQLTTARIERWLHGLADKGARMRSRRDEKPRHKAPPQSQDEIRARRATANRVWTILRAALNRAFKSRKVDDDRTWRAVEPFSQVDAARLDFLEKDQISRLVNAADKDSGFRDLVMAALLTGCRYGELCALDVSDFNAHTGKLYIRLSKSGQRRDVILDDLGIKFFHRLTVGRPPDGVMLTYHNWKRRKERAVANEFWRRVRSEHDKRVEHARADGRSRRGIGLTRVGEEMESKGGRATVAAEAEDDMRWHASEQLRPMAEACRAAQIKAIGFHQLRHTWASHAVMNDMPLLVVAKNLGHKDTRMVEKHYGHLSKDYRDTITRAHAPRFEFDIGAVNVQALRGKKTR